MGEMLSLGIAILIFLYTFFGTDGNGKSMHFIPGVSRVWPTSETGQYSLSMGQLLLLSLLNILQKAASICENPHQGQVFLLSCKSTVITSFSSVQLLSRVRLLVTPWTAVCQAPLSQRLLKLMLLKLLRRCCHPTVSFSVFPFSSRLQSFPASGSFPMSQFFASGGQSTGVSASALLHHAYTCIHEVLLQVRGQPKIGTFMLRVRTLEIYFQRISD